MKVKRKIIPEDQTRLIDDNTAIVKFSDLTNPKLNPTLRLDADFAIKLAKKIEKQNKKDIVGEEGY
ncbi:MAG: hypothetical protein KJI69_04630 [Patescibacteria group bacterium]|nr:hypothetical protein [Patescibacteria group bacterium]